MKIALTAHKQNITDLTAKRDLLQSKIDSGASDVNTRIEKIINSSIPQKIVI